MTGATGFIGRRLVQVLASSGCEVRALVRRMPPPDAPAGIAWVQGDLMNRDALATLLRGASAVVHLAGAIKALSRAAFMSANAEGTANVLEIAATQSNPPRFVHISSLAARAPHLSPYAASKAAAEEIAVRAAPQLPVTILRPPAVYGPSDSETLRIFRMAARGLMPVPAVPGARLSLVHVDDAAAAILATLRLSEPAAEALEFDDGAADGHSWDAIAATAGEALGRPVRTVSVPPKALYLYGFITNLASQATRRPNVLSHHKVRELLHPDWVVRSPQPPDYQPRWDLLTGFRDTARWATSQGLVRIFQGS